MRVLVSGDRNWPDIGYLNSTLDEVNRTYFIDLIIEGEASGADTLARMWAEEHHIPVMRFPAQWDKYGKAAGPIRNQQMLDEGKPDLVVAFHPNIQLSRGTKDMVSRAKRAGIEVILKDGHVDMVQD